MRVIIAGPRDFVDAKELKRAIKKSNFDITQVISGGALGVDRMGEEWANKKGIPLIIFPAQWEFFGKSAGHKRNKLMAEYAEALIAISIKDSSGTTNMIQTMKKEKKPVYIHYPCQKE
jgi:hypothetical protein